MMLIHMLIWETSKNIQHNLKVFKIEGCNLCMDVIFLLYLTNWHMHLMIIILRHDNGCDAVSMHHVTSNHDVMPTNVVFFVYFSIDLNKILYFLGQLLLIIDF